MHARNTARIICIHSAPPFPQMSRSAFKPLLRGSNRLLMRSNSKKLTAIVSPKPHHDEVKKEVA